MFYEFDGVRPVVHESAFVHPQAVVIGNVEIGKNVYVGPGAVIRGDWGEIIIADGCNVQENCVIHMFPAVSVMLDKDAHIGHGAIIHGATIGTNTLVGMNAVIMDRCIIGKECIIGALTFIKSDQIIPDRSVVIGNPGKIVKTVPDEMVEWKSEGTALYQKLPGQWSEQGAPCEPLREKRTIRVNQPGSYKTWKESQS
jgi:phenylacetic acid degradation protein